MFVNIDMGLCKPYATSAKRQLVVQQVGLTFGPTAFGYHNKIRAKATVTAGNRNGGPDRRAYRSNRGRRTQRRIVIHCDRKTVRLQTCLPDILINLGGNFEQFG